MTSRTYKKIEELWHVYRAFFEKETCERICEGPLCPSHDLFTSSGELQCASLEKARLSLDAGDFPRNIADARRHIATIQGCLVNRGFLSSELVETHNKRGTREYFFLQADGYRCSVKPPT